MLCSRGYAVSLSSLSENQLVTLKRQLTVEPVVDEKYKTADL